MSLRKWLSGHLVMNSLFRPASVAVLSVNLEVAMSCDVTCALKQCKLG